MEIKKNLVLLGMMGVGKTRIGNCMAKRLKIHFYDLDQLFEEKNDEIINFLENSTLVGHNLINFDLKFLNHYLNTELKNNTIDTLELSRSTLGGKVVNHKLNTLAEYFDVVLPTHSAKDDVMTTFEIYKKLLSIQ